MIDVGERVGYAGYSRLLNSVLRIVKQNRGESRVTGTEICRELGLNGGEVRRMIHVLRVEGCPIGSDGRGYFFAEKEAELDHTEKQILSRIYSMYDALRGMKKSFNPQYELFISREGTGQ